MLPTWMIFLFFLGDGADEPPLANRPPAFSGIVGQMTMALEASPTKVAVEEPITLRVHLQGKAAANYQPMRAKLRLFPEEISEDFFIEDVSTADTIDPENGKWSFVYKLRPKHSKIRMIDGLRLAYFDSIRRRYQLLQGDPIAVEVGPAKKLDVEIDPAVWDRVAGSFFELAQVDRVLETPPSGLRWRPTLVVVSLLVPLVSVVLGFLTRFGKASFKRRQGRILSPAASQALEKLRATEELEASAEILVEFLRERLDFRGIEPTACELESFLKACDVEKRIRALWSDWFNRCHVATYSPAGAHAVPTVSEAKTCVESLDFALNRQLSRLGPFSILAFVTLVVAGWWSTGIGHAEVAPSNQELAVRAENAFRMGREAGRNWSQARRAYQQAAKDYYELYRRGIRGSGLFQNLGNAEVLLDHWPAALWACQCGLKHHPNHAFLERHRDLLRQRVDTSAVRSPTSAWSAWVESVGTWALVVCTPMGIWLGFRVGRSPAPWEAILFVGVLILPAILAWEIFAGAEPLQPAVVIRNGTPVLTGNGDSYPRHASFSSLPAGFEVVVLHRRGEWLQIGLPNGEKAWIPPGSAWAVE